MRIHLKGMRVIDEFARGVLHHRCGGQHPLLSRHRRVPRLVTITVLSARGTLLSYMTAGSRYGVSGEPAASFSRALWSQSRFRLIHGRDALRRPHGGD